jgi:long-chain acyl-CoA synthetase
MRLGAKPDKNLSYQASVLSLMQFKSDLYGERTAFYLREDGLWKETTYAKLAEDVKRLSDYLIERGVERGDRIAILAESRPEWAVAFFAAIRSGAVVVPVDIKLTRPEQSSILADAEPRFLFVSAQMLATARDLQSTVPLPMSIVVMNRGESNAGYPSLAELRASTDCDGVERDFDETAMIVYTSGTTGCPKGVMISFRNLGYQVMNIECVMKLTSKDVLLSMLPLNHLLELTCGLLGVLYAGGAICYCHTLFPQEIAEVMRQRKVTAIITVPLFLKMVKGSIEREVERAGMFGRALFSVAFRLAPRRGPRFIKKLLFHKVYKQFGGRLKNFISGGSSLDSDVAAFFDRIGIPIYLGYGLTETSPVISVNTPKARRMNSVGRPLEGVRVRILSNGEKEGEGEILTAGPHVMQGYYRRADLTEKVVDQDGWFHTGDIGRLDKDGFLYITGRIKNIIVLGSGKKVNPDEVEAVIARSALIKEVCVLGSVSRHGLMRGTEEVCAVVVPSEAVMQTGDRSEMAERIKEEVARLSQNLALYKRPSRVCLYFEDLPKTPTRKIKRPVLLEWLARQEPAPAEASLPG